MPSALAASEIRRIGCRWVARIRFAAVSAFLLIALVAGVVFGKPQWAALLPLLSAYWLAAGGLALLSQHSSAAGPFTVWALPALDVTAMWALQHRAVAVAPSPGYVVGWSIGMFLFAVLVATVTFRPGVLWATVATGAVAQALLVAETSLGVDLMATSATLLTLGGLVTTAGARRLEHAIEDLFAKERARAEAEQQAAALRREHEAVRSWAELVVHDLKQPLTSAIGLAELCAAELDSPRGDARADLALISKELRRMELMVNDLVMTSRLEEGVLKPQLAEHPVRTILERLRQLHGAEAKARGVSLEVDAEASLAGTFDAALLLRALENLLANALRFTQQGDRIALHAHRNAKTLVLAVRNTGLRVPEAAKPTLFQKRTTSASEHSHAGLGLYFCRLVAEAHGGVARLADDAAWNVDFRIEL